MLTPRSDDENREAELARRERQPHTFMRTVQQVHSSLNIPEVSPMDNAKANAVADRLEAIKVANTNLNIAKEQMAEAQKALEDADGVLVEATASGKRKAIEEAEKAKGLVLNTVETVQKELDAAQAQFDKLMAD